AGAPPGCSVLSAGINAHIDAQLGNDDRPDHSVHARDLLQERQVGLVRLQLLVDAHVESGDAGLGSLHPVPLPLQPTAGAPTAPPPACADSAPARAALAAACMAPGSDGSARASAAARSTRCL